MKALEMDTFLHRSLVGYIKRKDGLILGKSGVLFLQKLKERRQSPETQ
jgi:hypothetical protein